MNQKVVVITGGSGTLGSELALGLAQDGAIVYLLARDDDKLHQVTATLQSKNLNCYAVSCDVLDVDSMNNAINIILSRSGNIDILINAAGGNTAGATIMPDQSIIDLDIDAFKDVTDLNLLGTIIPTKIVVKHMAHTGKGCIINISSMAALLPLTRVVGYSAAKAGIDNFTRWLAVELATKYGEGIRVNAIAPGFFIAEQNKSLLLQANGELTPRGKTIIEQTPMKRFGKPAEILSTVKWLCDDASTFITGIIVPIDGGFSAFSGV